MKKFDNKCTIVANFLILSDFVFLDFFNDSNANFENLLKQEITNLAIFLFFQVFKNLFSSI